ncbi:MAG: thioredoxin family protein [bacterium]|nr:thioredoxin family protein [bacterium]
MAKTLSSMLPLGTQAPDFDLPDFTGRNYSLNDFQEASALLVAFICNHCPFVIHVREEFSAMATKYQQKGVAVVAINSNDVTNYPQDRPEMMAKDARDYSYTFPYLFDETQKVAQAYKATCTPDFFLFNSDRQLVYRGQMDDSRPGNNAPIDGKDLKAAMDAVLEDRPVQEVQKPSMGCNIKWKPGNEPY